jgi:endoglucanase
LPNDDNLIVTIHSYSSFSFTHQGAAWITPVMPVGVSCCNTSQVTQMTTPLDSAKAWSTATHYPVFLGEFGA